jgi:hypothetical protein
MNEKSEKMAMKRGLSKIRSFKDVMIDTDTSLEWRKNKSPLDLIRALATRKLGTRIFRTIRRK